MEGNPQPQTQAAPAAEPKPVPASLAVIDGEPTAAPVAPAPQIPHTKEELMTAFGRAVALVKEAQDLQNKYGFALTQFVNPMTGLPEITFVITARGQAILGIEPKRGI